MVKKKVIRKRKPEPLLTYHDDVKVPPEMPYIVIILAILMDFWEKDKKLIIISACVIVLALSALIYVLSTNKITE